MQKAEEYKKHTQHNKPPSATETYRNYERTPEPSVKGSPHTSISQTDAYKQNALQTASRGDLTLLLYNGCLKFIDKADKALSDKNMEHKNKFIMRAQDIIRELMITLKTDTDTGKNMYQLYDFIHRRLIDANINNDKKALQEARDLTLDFRDTWKEIIKLDRQQRFGQKDQV